MGVGLGDVFGGGYHDLRFSFAVSVNSRHVACFDGADILLIASYSAIIHCFIPV